MRRLTLLALGLALTGAAGGVAAEPPADGPLWLHAEIERFVRARTPEPLDAVEIPPLTDLAPAGSDPAGLEVSLSARPPRRHTGRLPVVVALSRDGSEVRRAVVTVRVRSSRSALVATRRLARGAVLTEADLRPERRDQAELPEDWVRDAELAVGMRLRRGLAAGAPLSRGALEAAPLVARGAEVRLLLASGGLRIEARGRARDEGREGETIRVVNRDSGRELLGRVGPKGAVHVAF